MRRRWAKNYLSNMFKPKAKHYTVLFGILAITLASFIIVNRNQVGNEVGTGVLTVRQGGTGATSFDAGECLIGAGSGPITTGACGTGGSMVYPSAGIPLSTGSAWGTSITNNSANWNTAYGWGSHAGLYDVLGQATSTLATHTIAYNHATFLTSVASDSTWTTHNSYPSACLAGQFVTAIGDTLTCVSPSTYGFTNYGDFGSTIPHIFYDDTSGIYYIDPNYGIPSNASTTNWNTAYNWGNHAGLYDIFGQATSTLASHNTAYNHASFLTAVASDATWTIHNSYPAACSAGQYVSAIGDTLTCSTPTGGSGGIAGTIGQIPYFSGTNTAVGTSSITIDTNGRMKFEQNPFVATSSRLINDRQVYYTEFMAINVASYYPFFGVAISAGAAIMSSFANSSVIGTIALRDSATANAGYRILTDPLSMYLIGGESYSVIFNPVTKVNKKFVLGFTDATLISDPVDGVWLEYDYNASTTSIVGRTSVNNSRSTTASGFVFSNDAWYKGEIIINSDATAATFKIYDTDYQLLWSDTLSSNVPSGPTRPFGAGASAYENSTNAAQSLVILDYMEFIVPRKLFR